MIVCLMSKEREKKATKCNSKTVSKWSFTPERRHTFSNIAGLVLAKPSKIFILQPRHPFLVQLVICLFNPLHGTSVFGGHSNFTSTDMKKVISPITSRYSDNSGGDDNRLS